jgi:hypothetical protein
MDVKGFCKKFAHDLCMIQLVEEVLDNHYNVKYTEIVKGSLSPLTTFELSNGEYGSREIKSILNFWSYPGNFTIKSFHGDVISVTIILKPIKKF